MLSKLFEKLWNEAYQQNDTNIISLLEVNPKASLADIGCGDGVKTKKFGDAVKTGHTTGVDGVEARLAKAKKNGVESIKSVNLESAWNLADNTFDVVVSNQVIEHISDIDHFIEEIERILKPGGYAVISTENLSSWHNIFALILGFQDFSHHILKKSHAGNPLSPHFGEKTASWSAKGNSGTDDTAFPHIKILTLKSLMSAFETYNFKIEAGRGAGYYPLFGIIGKIASRIDPFHSHFITIKARKNH